MLTFSPIHKNIQETLFKKMDMLEKNPTVSIGTTLANKDGNPNENYMYARSVFLRMTSLLTVDNKPVVIMGGEMKDNKFQYGYDGIYGSRTIKPNKAEFEAGKEFIETNPLKRPIAGIKDVNVEYKGGGMKIGATRSTTISWTCWSWDELQRLKPFFLKHGRTVLVEFGWSFKGGDSPMFLDILDENGEIKNQTLKKGDKSLQDQIPEHILKQKGHYDATLGIIQNFEFTVNDTGGFDCTTELISLGVNALQKMDSKESMMGDLSGLPIFEPVEGFWWWEDAEYTTKLKEEKQLTLEPYYNFLAYMKSFQSHLHKNVRKSQGSIVFIGWRESKPDSSQYSGDKLVIENFSKSMLPYCTWGWFEDNVLSRFLGTVNENHDVVTEFRSIEPGYDIHGNFSGTKSVTIKTSTEMLTPDVGKWFFVKDEGGSIDNYGFFGASYDGPIAANFMPKLASKLMIDAYTKHFGALPKDDPVSGPDEPWTGNDYFRIFTPDGLGTPGNIRNIYFNFKFLEECFVEGGTIRGGIESVWNKFSAAYGGVYEFKIVMDEKEGKLMIKDTQYAESRLETVLQNTSKKLNYRDPDTKEISTPGVFVFPVWEKNSLVKSQNLKSNIPSRMQVAAMYGSNKADSVSDGLIENFDDWGATALGKAEAKSEKLTLKEIREREANAQLKMYDHLFGSIEHPFKKSGVGEPSFTFGNASADPTKPLQWKVGETNSTTGVYEDVELDTEIDKDTGMYIKSDVSGGTYNSNNQQSHGMPFMGINEVLEMQLHGEFQRRLRISLGEAAAELEKNERLKVGDVKAYEAKWRVKHLLKDKKEIYTGTSKYLKISNTEMGPEYKAMMSMAIKGTKDGLLKQSDPLIPIELELEIDGTGGIFPGNSFHSSYLPRSYMDRICFQVKGASHTVDSTGWTTTLVGQMRVAGYPPASGSEYEPMGRGDITGLRDEDGNLIPVNTVSTAQIGGTEITTYTAEGTTTAELEAEGLNEEQIEEFKNKTEFLDSNKEKDGTQIEILTETTTVESSAIVIDYFAEMDYESEAGIAALKEQNELAANIAALNGHWEVEHLMEFAYNADMYLPDLHMTNGGVTFLTWFQDNMGDSSIIPTGYFNRDKPAISDAYGVWWALQESIQPGEPEGGWPTAPLPDYSNLFGDD